ncbi:hypothetical protein H310_05575 [Aphanomyces invadans]|uniref:F-box domain-containing protein n=1 Tax=Aphanomyces invadans TaxID=157072 RepID=A0A024U9P7_9STRA|nr:hypothetical protein H310_05575 [Aphanomyces invadans]ETW03156.1 hypothetical protein H310_05575 [Aphanomyces invadans]|eukprot:XP_008868540.1 hypothetical protein H310_05575 [Aphanomyces invadans]
MELVVSADVALVIFGYLAPQELVAMEQTCRRFQLLVVTNRIWKPLYSALYPISRFNLLRGRTTWKQVFVDKCNQQLGWKKGTARCVLSQIAHTDGINAIAAQKSLGPYANLFATCSFDRTVKVWRKPTTVMSDTATLCTLAGHQNAVWSLAWGPSPSDLYSASFDGTIRRWDVTTAVNTRVLWANADRLLCMVIEHDNVWTGSLTGHLIQWTNSSSNPAIGRIQCVTPCISSLQKYNHLLYVGGVKHLEIWDDRYLVAPVALFKGHEQAIMSMAMFSSDIVMTVSKDGTLKGWDATGSDPTPLLDVRVHSAAVRSIATCDDLVVTSSNDSTVRLWQASSKWSQKSSVVGCLTRLDGLHVHTKQVPSVDMDECHLYTASCDSTMTIHEYTIP